MGDPLETQARGYDGFYAEFDSPLARQLRAEAYGEDIGQHSWVTADELREDVVRLGLSPSSRLLDLGCGPGGPLSFVLGCSGCRGEGIEVSASALAAARARAAALGLGGRVAFRAVDLDGPLPFEDGSFDAAMSLDVVLHLRDRERLFGEVARVLAPEGRFLFTDAGVLRGAISDEEVRRRSLHGRTWLSAPDFNERALARAGLRLVGSWDRTAGLLQNASGRLRARRAHRAELQALEGKEAFEAQERYLETVLALSERGALSRVAYLAQPPR